MTKLVREGVHEGGMIGEMDGWGRGSVELLQLMLAGTLPKSISGTVTGRGSETATRHVGTVDLQCVWSVLLVGGRVKCAIGSR